MRHLVTGIAAAFALASASAAAAQVTPPPKHTTVGGDVVRRFVGWSDGNVLAHLIKGDSLAIALSQLALERSTNTQLQALARSLIRDHTVSMSAGRALPRSPAMATTLHRSDRSMDHLVMAFKELRPLSGTDFDRAWLRHQIMFHHEHLRLVEPLEEATQREDIEELVERSEDPVRRHLERLNALARQLNVTPRAAPPRQ